MTSTSIDAYADAAVALGRADGSLRTVEDELFRVGQAVSGSDELRTALGDPHVPVARRQQIIEDLLAGSATPATVAISSLMVGAGKAADIGRVAAAVAQRSAASAGRSVAEVRSAIALTDEQVERLAVAITARTGRQVTVRNIVDPSVMGGLVTTIGDSVIDGSVRSRLTKLREAF